MNLPAAILLETALIFFRPLLVQSESADDLFELLVLFAKLSNFKGTCAGVVGLSLEPTIYRVPADVVFGTNIGNGVAVLNL